tara:strand:+ start:370 stop:654 length:285 start_codon:yes stop_codon:yes gene_type:complete
MERSPALLMEEELCALGRTRFVATVPELFRAIKVVGKVGADMLKPIDAFEERCREDSWRPLESPWTPAEGIELARLRDVVSQASLIIATLEETI